MAFSLCLMAKKDKQTNQKSKKPKKEPNGTSLDIDA